MQLSRQIMQLATEVQEGDHAVRCARWTLERESESSGVLSALIWPACRDLGWRVFPLLNGPLTASRCGVGCTDRDSYVTTTDEADEKTRRAAVPVARGGANGGPRRCLVHRGHRRGRAARWSPTWRALAVSWNAMPYFTLKR